MPHIRVSSERKDAFFGQMKKDLQGKSQDRCMVIVSFRKGSEEVFEMYQFEFPRSKSVPGSIKRKIPEII